MNTISSGRARGETIQPEFTHPIRLAPSQGWLKLGLAELWQYRELLYFLAWRDVRVRYKQTVLGAGWAIIQPFMTMVVFSLFFGHLVKIPSDGVPYPIFAYTALVPWTFFASSLGRSTGSLVSSSYLLKKVYFPRLIVPLSAILPGLLDFILAMSVLIGMMLWYRILPSWNTLWLPALFLLALATALGTGLWLSALNVAFRDVSYVLPFLLQIWMFATPIVYPSSLVPESWRLLYSLNPMVGVIEGFRWALLGVQSAPGPMILISAAVALTLCVSGAFYFRRVERHFADIV